MIRPSFGRFTSNPNPVETVEKSDINLSLFPNPTKDVLYFEPGNNKLAKYNVRVYNIMGVMLINTISTDNSINVSSLKEGIYILQITSADNNVNVTSKFIKE
jgi:hypothetical protein